MTDRQGGFTLIEALIASMIAALFISAAYGLMSQSIILADRAANAIIRISEARRIHARVRADAPDSALLEGLSDWSMSVEPYEVGDVRSSRTDDGGLKRYTFTHASDRRAQFESVVYRAGTP
ncbi:MAG: prepilin-type N-terminal cleavage/methylation domain-containing protein [Pseudomonadota bacterium]